MQDVVTKPLLRGRRPPRGGIWQHEKVARAKSNNFFPTHVFHWSRRTSQPRWLKKQGGHQAPRNNKVKSDLILKLHLNSIFSCPNRWENKTRLQLRVCCEKRLRVIIEVQMTHLTAPIYGRHEFRGKGLACISCDFSILGIGRKWALLIAGCGDFNTRPLPATTLDVPLGCRTPPSTLVIKSFHTPTWFSEVLRGVNPGDL